MCKQFRRLAVERDRQAIPLMWFVRVRSFWRPIAKRWIEIAGYRRAIMAWVMLALLVAVIATWIESRILAWMF
jgi:hypothetical protein